MKHVYLLNMPQKSTAPVGFQRVGSYNTWSEANTAALPLRTEPKTRQLVRIYDDEGQLLRPRVAA